MNQPDDQEPRGRFPGPNARQQIKFSPEEARVIRECNRDSFYQRCLPIGIAFGTSTFYGVKAGYLKPNARFGATPKVMAAITVGYFLGKFSYQRKCAEKLMELPHSQLGEMLRQRRAGNIRETYEPGFGPAIGLAPFSGTDRQSEFNPNNSLDFDIDRPSNEGLDDSHRPSMDNPASHEDEMPPLQKHTTSYEELRKKNRDEYQSKRVGNYREQPVRSIPTAPSTDNTPRPARNQYGDVFEQ